MEGNQALQRRLWLPAVSFCFFPHGELHGGTSDEGGGTPAPSLNLPMETEIIVVKEVH